MSGVELTIRCCRYETRPSNHPCGASSRPCGMVFATYVVVLGRGSHLCHHAASKCRVWNHEAADPATSVHGCRSWLNEPVVRWSGYRSRRMDSNRGRGRAHRPAPREAFARTTQKSWGASIGMPTFPAPYISAFRTCTAHYEQQCNESSFRSASLGVANCK